MQCNLGNKCSTQIFLRGPHVHSGEKPPRPVCHLIAMPGVTALPYIFLCCLWCNKLILLHILYLVKLNDSKWLFPKLVPGWFPRFVPRWCFGKTTVSWNGFRFSKNSQQIFPRQNQNKTFQTPTLTTNPILFFNVSWLVYGVHVVRVGKCAEIIEKYWGNK